ncbi:MAG: helix-turn-helix domain-containing protein [Ginsengibacter sp.]
MPLELLTIKDLNDLKAELIKEIKQLLVKNDDPGNPKRLLKSREVRTILRISPGTLQNLRRNETLYYRKVGGIIYYHYEDIERLMRKV